MSVDTVPTGRIGIRRVIALTAATIGVINGYDLIANLIIAQYFLSALESLGGVNTFGLLLALAIVSWFFIYRFAPETKGRQLEAIHEYCENGGVWPEPADRGSRAA
jgi:hypothetical protein